MTVPYGESKYIFGFHEPGGEWLMTEAGKPGWITFTHELGHDPTDMGSFDYSGWADQGFGIIARLNHGYGEAGTIPFPELYDYFAQRVANFVQSSQGCHVWVIGNEINHVQERPAGEPILPMDYAICYVECAYAIRSLPGHSNDQVLVAAIAPWNVETKYPGNESGDWIKYFIDVLRATGSYIGGIALHTYSHGSDPGLIFSGDKMEPPYEDRFYHFWAYRDFMKAIPDWVPVDMPIYITETDQDDPWKDVNSGWVQKAYYEINCWNAENGRKIRGVCLYRWPKFDKWYIEDKTGVYDDFRAAMQHDYIWIDDETNGGNMSWAVVYENNLEAGFYDQDNTDELTIPLFHRVLWNTELPRPEMDAKDADLGHSEVFEGRYSAVGFLPHAEFQWWCYTDPISVAAGLRTQASAQLMIVAHGEEGDPDKPGACGMRVGGGPADSLDALQATGGSPDIVWSDWWAVRNNLDNERKWYEMITPEFIPDVGLIRLYIQCNNDVASDISAGHWDMERIEQFGESPEPGPQPPPGELQAALYGIAADIEAVAADSAAGIREVADNLGSNLVVKQLVEGAVADLQQALLSL